MSYNISTVQSQTITALTVETKFLNTVGDKEYHPKMNILDLGSMKVELELGCGQTITGYIKDGVLTITDMDLSGEGSGSLMHHYVEPLLKKSKGQYRAVFIWEGGDSITKFTVKDGKVDEKNHSVLEIEINERVDELIEEAISSIYGKPLSRAQLKKVIIEMIKGI